MKYLFVGGFADGKRLEAEGVTMEVQRLAEFNAAPLVGTDPQTGREGDMGRVESQIYARRTLGGIEFFTLKDQSVHDTVKLLLGGYNPNTRR